MQAVLRLVPDDTLAAVDHVGRDLVAAIGREAVHEDRIVLREGHELRIDSVASEEFDALGLLLLLAHGHPGVGHDDIRPRDGLLGVIEALDRTARRCRDRHRVVDDGLRRVEALRCRDAHVHAGRRTRERVGLRHVAGAVADEGHGLTLKRTAVLANGQQVCKELTRVEVVGERVDDGDGRALRHLLEPGLAVGAPHDRGNHALEHPRGVGRGLLATELAVGRADDERHSPEVSDAHREGDARARGRLVEDHRNGLRALERALRETVGLERHRKVENLALLGLRQVVIAKEMPGHCAASNAVLKSLPNSSISTSPTMRGGAIRTLYSFAALTMRPASSAAADTLFATGSVRPTPISRPRPRTSSTSGESISRISSRSCVPRCSALPIRSDASISPSTALAAAVASGLPPKVLPWWPRLKSSDASPKVTRALMGMPPAMPFAIVTASGSMSNCW